VTLARAGHPLPLVLRADGTLTKIRRSDGGLLGVFPDESLRRCSPSRSIPAIVSCSSPTASKSVFGGRTPIDETAWHFELTQRNALSGNELLLGLARKLDESAGSLDPKDDLTMIVVEAKAA
jgi:hypothetical protein